MGGHYSVWVWIATAVSRIRVSGGGCGAGDGEAFGVIFDRHAGAVFGQCRRRAESVADAEDLASIVFLEALRRAADVRFVDGSVRPWLLVVATNTARNQARARRRYRLMLSKLPDPGAEPDVADEVVRISSSFPGDGGQQCVNCWSTRLDRRPDRSGGGRRNL